MADELDGGIHRERISFLRSSKSFNIDDLSNGLTQVSNGLNSNKVVVIQEEKLVSNINNAKACRLPKLYKPRDLFFSIFSTGFFICNNGG